MADQRERIDDIGEFGLIDRIAALLAAEAPAGPVIELGIGDDAAIWQPAPDHAVVITTDVLVEAIHFRLDLMSWEDIGHRAMAANLSDLASMAATPAAAVVSLGLRPGLLVDDVLDFYRGLASLAQCHGCAIVGGDIVASPTALMVNVTVFGQARRGSDGRTLGFRRDAARPGDLIAVSGPLGLSAAGLRLLLANPAGANADAAAAPLLAAYRRPLPRLEVAAALLAAGVCAGMDLSDGLAGDLPKMCGRSGVSAVLDLAALPVPALVRQRFPEHWLDLALRGGEDFELLVTAPPATVAAVQVELAARGLPPFHVIGEVTAPRQAAVWAKQPDGQLVPLASGAFDHFGGGR